MNIHALFIIYWIYFAFYNLNFTFMAWIQLTIFVISGPILFHYSCVTVFSFYFKEIFRFLIFYSNFYQMCFIRFKSGDWGCTLIILGKL